MKYLYFHVEIRSFSITIVIPSYPDKSRDFYFSSINYKQAKAFIEILPFFFLEKFPVPHRLDVLSYHTDLSGGWHGNIHEHSVLGKFHVTFTKTKAAYWKRFAMHCK